MKLNIHPEIWTEIMKALNVLPAGQIRAVLNAIDDPKLCNVIDEVAEKAAHDAEIAQAVANAVAQAVPPVGAPQAPQVQPAAQ